jgi:hypothetical protein
MEFRVKGFRGVISTSADLWKSSVLSSEKKYCPERRKYAPLEIGLSY